MARRSVNGFLLLDKPIGLSSNQALQSAKKLFQASKAGHAGSLDPIASGMLLLCFGEYTKFAQFLLDADKRYIVTGKLGERTETADSEGAVISTRPVSPISIEALEKVLQPFRGEISQIPSMYSALKHNGEPLYKLARQGITVERAPRQLTIHDLTLLELTDTTITLSVHCSKGTYIRNLIEDIGEALGCGAHVIALRRTQIGGFTEDRMTSLPQLESLRDEHSFENLDKCLVGLNCASAFYPEVQLTESMTFYIKQGQAVFVPKAPSSGMIILKNPQGDYLGVGHILDDGRVAPKRLFTRAIS